MSVVRQHINTSTRKILSLHFYRHHDKQMKKILQNLFIGIFICANINTTFAQDHSIAREWNEVLLNAIRNDFARPTVHARNLWHSSIAMYDIWAVYDDNAETYLLGKTVDGFTCEFEGVPVPDDIEAARHEAISYAMNRLIRHRFLNAPGAVFIITEANNTLVGAGYTPAFTSTNYLTGEPAALGNYMAACLINFGLQDGSNESDAYGNLHYEPVNPPLETSEPGNPDILDPNRWQPLTLVDGEDQAGNPTGDTPAFLSPEWGNVPPFAMTADDMTTYQRDGNDYFVYNDPGAPPYLDTNQVTPISEEYQWGFSLVSKWSSHLDATDGVMWDISPASIGNVQEYPTTIEDLRDFYDEVNGGDPGIGRTINPHTNEPYEPQMVPRGDYTRVLAEFWADGPDSETPPGHWFTILNYVNDNPLLEKKFRGVVDLENDLEWDVKAYFALGGAMHDSAISAWSCKGWYDYIRPMSAIRCMADNGQSSLPNFPGFHPGGIPLSTNFVARVGAFDPLAGDNDENVGKIKVFAWRGPDYITFINDVALNEAGVGWILAEEWWPYQRPSFVTPPFAGYVSGHSTYSRAAAEVLTLLTGDEYFPGGMGEFPVEMNEFLVFEQGPSQSFTLQWATYRDASDQCSLSRIWGGIHPPADDIPGRLMGMEIGVDAFLHAESYFYRDQDGDGYYEYEDCDDNNAAIYPGAAEICDALDNDCNGLADDGIPKNTYFFDNDGDGFGNINLMIDTCLTTAPTGYVDNDTDCNDSNADVNPSINEICNNIDDNCDGAVNEGLTFTTYYRDNDSDGFGDINLTVDTCTTTPPLGYVTNSNDCDDTKANVYPGATEICNGIDDNCDGGIDEGLTFTTYYLDLDGDGFGSAASGGGVSLDTCLIVPPTGYAANNYDCNDADANIHPDSPEICDAIDNNCNGLINDGLPRFTYYFDNDGDGFGNELMSIDTCTTAPPNYVSVALDCNDEDANVNPNSLEICDAIDNDCNGAINDGLPRFVYYFDNDGDGFGDELISIDTCTTALPSYVSIAFDCNDEDADINPDSPEICDTIDNDCNGLPDDRLPKNRYYLDADGDSYGNINMTVDTCISEPPTGYVTDNTDCDDTRSDSYPNATEIPDDDIDQDCTGKDLYLETKIFPNPTRGNVSVRHAYAGVARVQVVDAHGRIAKEGFVQFTDNETTMDVSFLTSGIYFIRFFDLEEEKQLFVEKLMRY